MQNCKAPNNGGNILRHEDGKIKLYDQSANEISAFADWSADVVSLETAIDSKVSKSTYSSDKTAQKKTYGHSLALDGSTLKLMDNQATPAVLSSVNLPSGGGAGVHAHAMALYFNATTEEDNYVKCEYAADGIRIKPHTTTTSTDLRFEIELTDPTKYVFDTGKPVYWRYYAYNGSYHIYVPMTISEQVYIPSLETPTDATTPLLCTQSLDWQTYDTDRVIIEVFAELVPAE